ncbi:hypothetical protein E2C01_057139 [Portunus trituberculatus]|uniref:Uncharacterized protein n=1 Tax=Portunus trituberculatus TaxID=210409 RepID=A0A5B7H1I8_PORTR|nr:hypothetical protein [Portunus trituberculatus]
MPSVPQQPHYTVIKATCHSAQLNERAARPKTKVRRDPLRSLPWPAKPTFYFVREVIGVHAFAPLADHGIHLTCAREKKKHSCVSLYSKRSQFSPFSLQQAGLATPTRLWQTRFLS